MLIDAHVHLHPSVDPCGFLDAAAKGFGAVGSSTLSMLWLAEMAGVDRFADCAKRVGDPEENARWSWHRTAEDCSLLARPAVADPKALGAVVLVSGRQIVTAEGLEVAAIGTRAVFDDGQPIDEVLANVRDSGAMAVLPLGFMKWQGGRGELVKQLIEKAKPGELYVGDNMGCWRGRPEHPLITLAKEKGIANLPGSDPLQLGEGSRGIGGYGVELQEDSRLNTAGWLDSPGDANPWRDTHQAIASLPELPMTFGGRQGLAGFVREQAMMQLKKRIG